MSISHHDFAEAVGAAILAPSLHNSQPWRFRRCGDEVWVLADPSRTPPIADARGWATRIACGAATYNLQLAFAVAGRPMSVHWRPDPGRPTAVAVLRPTAPRGPTAQQLRLFDAIPRRHSNRRPFHPRPVPVEARVALVAAASAEGAWIDLVVGAIPAAAVSEISHAANRVLHRNPDYVSELASWIHRGRAETAGGGADGAGLYELLPQRPVDDLVRRTGTTYVDEPLIAVLGTAGDTPRDQLHAGYALQRVLLTITDHNLASSLLSSPIEVPSAREQLRIALGRFGTPQMLLRIGYADPAAATPRRSVAEVIDASVDGPPGPEAPSPSALPRMADSDRC
jgi:nitroreductase